MENLNQLIVSEAIRIILIVIGLAKVFEKAGEKGWKAIIPFYNLYIVFKIIGKEKKFPVIIVLAVIAIILAVLPSIISISTLNAIIVVSYVILIAILFVTLVTVPFDLSIKFNHGGLFGLGLLFFMPILMLVLGFDSSEYVGITETKEEKAN